ncbi:MAG: hypothetical protein QOJ07_3299 [Thermoleophilaceae bacterium]|jgi:hypothetical protein|nr:hypothetical protein [Thermoleophilaceae bacterium]
MADTRRTDSDQVADIDCEVPRDMTLREWRGARPPARAGRLRAAAAAVGRALRRRH